MKQNIQNFIRASLPQGWIMTFQKNGFANSRNLCQKATDSELWPASFDHLCWWFCFVRSWNPPPKFLEGPRWTTPVGRHRGSWTISWPASWNFEVWRRWEIWIWHAILRRSHDWGVQEGRGCHWGQTCEHPFPWQMQEIWRWRRRSSCWNAPWISIIHPDEIDVACKVGQTRLAEGYLLACHACLDLDQILWCQLAAHHWIPCQNRWHEAYWVHRGQEGESLPGCILRCKFLWGSSRLLFNLRGVDRACRRTLCIPVVMDK